MPEREPLWSEGKARAKIAEREWETAAAAISRVFREWAQRTGVHKGRRGESGQKDERTNRRKKEGGEDRDR